MFSFGCLVDSLVVEFSGQWWLRSVRFVHCSVESFLGAALSVSVCDFSI